MSHLSEREVFVKTLYAEARGEKTEGQVWVAWVIKNRARMNRSYWGGGTIKGVCLHPGQFECWNGRSDIDVSAEPNAYDSCSKVVDAVCASNQDPTGGADHYNNPSKEGTPAWTHNCKVIKQIGSHVFYKGP